MDKPSETTEKRIVEEAERLNDELHTLNKNVDRQNRQGTLLYGFFHGIIAALGATIGAGLLLAGIVYGLRYVAIHSHIFANFASTALHAIQRNSKPGS